MFSHWGLEAVYCYSEVSSIQLEIAYPLVYYSYYNIYPCKHTAWHFSETSAEYIFVILSSTP